MNFYLNLLGLFAFFVSIVAQQNCTTNEFKCNNNRCITFGYICDGDNDCGDGSDEPPIINPDLCPECWTGYFRCDGGNCVQSSYICDFDNDCGDGSDERQDCPPCPEDRFSCDIGGCVSQSATCNGRNDCGDWSDEKDENCPCPDSQLRCSSPIPPPGQFAAPGDCILEEYWCDPQGIWDCPNGDDELNCTARHPKNITLRHH